MAGDSGMSTMIELVVFPIPLRDDIVAQVKVPYDLTKEEAEKIARVVMALATPPARP